MLKKCCKCKEEKPKTDFYRNRQKPDGRQYMCKICQRNYHNKEWYVKNREKRIKHMAKRKARLQAENYEKVLYLYFVKGCVDCGTKDHRVLEFDHVRGIKKKFYRTEGVSYMVRAGYKWSTIKAEIDKCEVRCRNCHKIKTYKDYDYYKDIQTMIKEYEKNMELSYSEVRYNYNKEKDN
tara:strand:+ start:4080 stop:4616 length:537 start_codon:yes stop_codon:yes gene_type:complete